MRKIQLDLGELRVDSFSAGEGEEARGTVRGLTGIPACCSFPNSQNGVCTGFDSCSGDVACLCDSVKGC